MATHRTTRREMLKVSAATAATAALGFPSLVRAAPESTAANSKLRLALVGCGGQGRGVMGGLIGAGGVLVALCDPDQAMIEAARGLKGGKDAKAYEDYRKLLDEAGTIDGVLVGTPDHWHAPISKAFMKAGKHVYCEKPLTHSVGEARELRELARTSQVVTQMGNQGSASASMRRCIEIIQAGRLGTIREIYEWGIGVTAREGSAEGEDPVPAGFNWDLWVGPSGMRPFKAKVYHPFRWRDWFDFGNGGLADIGCHSINLPHRALDLDYPEKIVINVEGGKQVKDKAAVEFCFPAKGSRPAVRLHWQGNGLPPAEIIQPLKDAYKSNIPGGVMIVGEKGCIYSSHWNTGGLIRLQGEEKLKDVLHHEATKDVPQTQPRTANHGQEWVDACLGKSGAKTYSDFEIGGKLTEIVLAGVVGLRAGKGLDWNGEKMEAANAPEAARFVHQDYRKKWL